jgi:muramidase (phage lysozyme)
MPSSKFGSKFLGEERYQQYVDELTAEGTIDGEKLSPEERKEGFKKRNDKIGFQDFVEKVLDKKQSATVSKGPTALPGGGGGGALVKRPKAGISKFDPSKIAPAAAAGGGILEEILKIVTSIRDTLIEKNEFDVDQSKKDSQSAERAKRAKKEKGLESGIFKGLAKATEKVLAPVKGMFEKIFDFIKTVILGNIVMNILKWMGDPKNEGKIKNLIRFFKDFWPAIVGAYLLFGTKFGALIRTIGGWAVQILRFAVPKLLRFVSRNPKAAAALAVAGGVGMLGARILTGTEVGADEEPPEGEQTPEQQQEADFRAAQATATDSLRVEEEPAKMSQGGRVPGSGNKDTVPAMLTPGEFVMSKGAVSKYGTNTLAAMNSMGGGTNIPSLMGGGVLGFSGGGSVSEKEEPGGRNKEGTEEPQKASGGGIQDWVMSFFRGGDKPKSEEGGGEEGGNGMSKNAKALLNTIRWAEGTLKPDGYNTWFGGRSDMDLTKMTIDEVVAEQKRRLSAGEATYGQYTSAAVGAYQMMKPEAFAAKAGLSGNSLFSPENQDKMAIAGYMMGQAGMTQAEIDAPISREQIAKIAPVWASLPMMSGRSRYGQPVKRYEDLVSVYQKNLSGLDPSSFSATTTLAAGGATGVTPSTGSPSSSTASTGSGGSVPKFDYKKIRQELGVTTASVSKPSRPSSTAAYTQMQQGQQQSPQKTEKSQSPGIPSFDAAAMSSSKKIKTLGITV